MSLAAKAGLVAADNTASAALVMDSNAMAALYAPIKIFEPAMPMADMVLSFQR
jgi:hypothetical protein